MASNKERTDDAAKPKAETPKETPEVETQVKPEAAREKASLPPQEGAHGPPKPEAEPKPKAAPKGDAKPLIAKVAAGKSVTSLRNILGPGTEVTARDFSGGEETLRALVAAGVVVEA